MVQHSHHLLLPLPLKTAILKAMKSAYVNPFNDFFIRFLLGSEGNEDLCRSFINTVLDDAGFPPVSKVTIKNPFNIKEAASAKESVTDVKVETGEGQVFDVEVQTGRHRAFEKRSLFYWAKMYAAQISEGEGYELLRPVVIINLLDYVEWEGVDRPHSCFMLMDKKNPEYVLTADLVIHYIEAPKLEKFGESLSPPLRRWLSYLKNEGRKGEKEMQVLMKDDPALLKAHGLYKRFTGTPEYVEAYEARQKWQRDYVTDMGAAKRSGIEEGIEKGIEKGMEKGRREGEITGIIDSILLALGMRGPLPPDLEERLQNQKDLDVLKSWLNHALRARSIEDFLERLDPL